MRPTRAVIDLDALRHNLQVTRRVAPYSKVLAVIKADAYGHGAVVCAEALGPRTDGFGVATLDEALELRTAGVRHPVVLMAGFFEADELPTLSEQRLDPVIHSPWQVEQLLEASIEAPVRVWLKLDTGMHRLGLTADEFRTAYARLRQAPQVEDVVLMTHFADADETSNRETAAQFERFQQTTSGLEGAQSLANSAAILAWPETHGDWTRPGMMLYGWSPLDRPTPACDELQPVMRLESSVIALHRLEAGETVGYGSRYLCSRPTLIGVVALGYGDGYPRTAPDGTPVLVNDRRCTVAGTVSMDFITVDLTGAEETRVGDPVELWGPSLSANEVATHCGTIAYELLTRVSSRVPRHYVERDERDEENSLSPHG